MNIVVLDGKAFNPGDLSWEPLRSLGTLTVYDNSDDAEVPGRAGEAEIVLTNKIRFPASMLQQLPRLRYLGILATGYNTIDVVAAARQGVTVTNVPGYSTDSVAQLAWAHLLNLTFRLADHAVSVRRGDWCRSDTFCYWNGPLIELTDLTLGLIGYGAIGRRVGEIATTFGMRLLIHTPHLEPGQELTPTAQTATLEMLLARSDVVSLHCPLTAENRGLINAERLALMKPTAFLINTARGPLIDETALAVALRTGRLAGAGLDVLAAEPPSEDCPLFGLDNCFITPHIAWGTLAARKRLLNVVVTNIAAFLAGTPTNIVSH